MLLQERTIVVDTIAEDVGVKVAGDKKPFITKDEIFDKIGELRIHRRELLANSPLRGQDKDKCVRKIELAGKTNATYLRIVERIRQNTDYFKELEQMGMLYPVVFNLDTRGRNTYEAQAFDFGGVRVKKVDMDEELMGEYNHFSEQIEINKKIANGRIEDILMMVTKGKLSVYAEFLAHEKLHQIQANNIPRMLIGVLELQEAQAYRTCNDKINSAGVLANLILTARDKQGNLVYPDLDPVKMLNAVDRIDKMRALGFGVTVVTGLVRNPGRWNERRKCFEIIDEHLLKAMEGLKLDEQGLSDLGAFEKVKNQVLQEQVRIIAEEEVYKTLSE